MTLAKSQTKSLESQKLLEKMNFRIVPKSLKNSYWPQAYYFFSENHGWNRSRSSEKQYFKRPFLSTWIFVDVLICFQHICGNLWYFTFIHLFWRLLQTFQRLLNLNLLIFEASPAKGYHETLGNNEIKWDFCHLYRISTPNLTLQNVHR